MIDALTILTAWPVLISAAVGLIKKLATLMGWRDSERFVRLLPLMPEAMGVLSAPVVVYVFALRVTWVAPEQLLALPWWFAGLVLAWTGVGAGAVSSKGWKVLKQSVRGEDARL